MTTVKVTITKVVVQHQPTFVEFYLTDIHGKKHFFHDKIVIVSPRYYIEEADLPEKGTLCCTVKEQRGNSYIIDTDTPDYVESLDGSTVFEVAPEQIEFQGEGL